MTGLVFNPEEIAAYVAEGRATAESLMTDTVTVTRKAGKPITDPITGKVTQPTTTVYPTGDEDGRGRIQGAGTQDRIVQTEGQRFTLEPDVLQVPITVDLQVDDEVHVTASALDPRLVGSTYRVTGVLRKAHATARRASIEEVTA